MTRQSSPLSEEDGLNHNATNGFVKTNGNGAYYENEDTPMSEDDDRPLSQALVTPSRKRKVIRDDSSSDDDVPLISSSQQRPSTAPVDKPSHSTAVASGKSRARGGKATAKRVDPDDDDDDQPLVPNKRSARKPPKKKAKVQDSNPGASGIDEDDKPLVPAKNSSTRGKRKAKVESEDDDDAPLVKKPTSTKARGKAVKKEEGSGTETPKPKKKGSKAKKEDNGEEESPKKGKKAKKEEEEEEETHRWWDNENPAGDGTQKWQTMQHNGVYFPPPYEPLPSHVKMKYDGKPVSLLDEAEEVAGFYGALLETPHAEDEVFNKNFFRDWLEVLRRYPPRDGTKIKEFALCDFRPMFEYFEAEKAKKKALSTAEKKELKKAKDELEAPYAHCVLDGRKEKVGNFRIEPPGLFRGRGEHPKKGSLKHRVRPEDVTINIGQHEPIPEPNVRGTWKQVIHDNTVTWLANWVENVNQNHKYVFLAAGSSLKGQSDMSKFEKARELKNHVDRIRADYREELKSKQMADRQRATAMYLIDVLALRAGNEKGEDEADTVGCCSLRCEHVTLQPPNILCFDFLGKDSIRYYKQVEVDPQVFKNMRIFKQNKTDEDALLDRVHTSKLNGHLNGYMKGLTAKVFRTFNASQTFQIQLDEKTPHNGTVQEKLNAYNEANRMVAILCNHQRTVPKTHEQSMARMGDKIRQLKYERMKLRHVLFGIDKKYKKNKKYAEDESDVDEEAVVEIEEKMKEKEKEKTEKKFAKENEKLVADDGKPQDDSVLQERLGEIDAEFERLAEERGTGKASLKREKPAEKIEEAIEKLDDRIATAKLQMVDREAGKEIALGTSKINYLDPRITVAWCKKFDVPLEKLFSKTLLQKFPWALEAGSDWKF